MEFFFDEEIAAECIAVVLDDDVVIALRAEGALGVSRTEAVRQDAVEDTDADFFDAEFKPAVKDSVEKGAVLVGCYAVRSDLPCKIFFDARYELEVFDLTGGEEIKQLIGIVNVSIIEQDEDVELDIVFSAFFYSCDDFIKSTFTGAVFAIMVVVILRTIEAYADEELVFGKESAPIVVEEYCVCLEGVGNHLAVGAVFLLQGDKFFVKVKPHQSGFAPLPCKTGGGKVQGEVAFYKGIQYLLAHAVGAFFEEFFFAGIEAVFACDIAIRTGRLY